MSPRRWLQFKYRDKNLHATSAPLIVIPDRRHGRRGRRPPSRLSKEQPRRQVVRRPAGRHLSRPSTKAGRGRQANEAVAGTLGEPQRAMGDRSSGGRRINGGKSAVAADGRTDGRGRSLTLSLCRRHSPLHCTALVILSLNELDTKTTVNQARNAGGRAGNGRNWTGRFATDGRNSKCNVVR